MRRYLLAIAAASMPLTVAISAEPAKVPVRNASQPAKNGAPVFVAVAEQATADVEQPQPQPQAQADESARPARHARVTSCRCGDQTPGK